MMYCTGIEVTPDYAEVLAPLGHKVQNFVHTAGLMTIVEGCDIDKTMAYFAYRHSAEVNWKDLSMVYNSLLHDCNTRIVAGLRDGGP